MPRPWADPSGLRARFAAAVAADPDLPPSGATVVLAVSGGADSCALWDLCAGLGRWRLVIWHLDHALRADSAADAAFVHARGAQYAAIDPGFDAKTSVLSVRRPVAPAARRARVGVEAAGRTLRLNLLRAVVAKRCAVGAMTAHHHDDQAETALMQLLRGAGPAGAPGLRPRRVIHGLTLWRPLLPFTRAELRVHLDAVGLAWREDASNRDADFRRNLIRLRVMPVCEAAVPGFSRELARRAAAVEVTDDSADLAGISGDRDGELALTGPWLDEPAQRRHYWARLLDALGAGPGRARVRLLDALVTPRENAENSARNPTSLRLGRWDFSLGGEAGVPHLRWRRHRTRLAMSTTMAGPGRFHRDGEVIDLESAEIPASPVAGPGACWLDAGALRWPLVWRPAKTGERWQPLGCTGHQTIAKYLGSRKIPLADRRAVAVVADGEGVVWIPGHGIAERVRIGPGTTAVIRASLSRGVRPQA
jgi:tRNA(Ile)-lysidine synthase